MIRNFFRMEICRSFLFVLLISIFVSFTLAEIRYTEIRSDAHPIIPFDEFGFTHTGRLELNISYFALSDSNPNLDVSKLGFFLCTRDAWIYVLHQLEDGKILCPLNSELVKAVSTFKSLNGKSSFHIVYQQTNVDQYTLVFANCLYQVKVSMNV
ncbi:hypothetical protein PTKIN_Ptkin04bG0165000 [Pterospermum kingtungense]